MNKKTNKTNANMNEFRGETTNKRGSFKDFKSERSEADNEKKKFKDKAKMKEFKKQSRLRKRRLIVRNLSFKATEEDLRKLFSKYGNVVDVTIPLMENKLKRGFAFVQYEHFNSIIKAMKELNYKEIHGRAIAIDYAVDKGKYQQKLEDNKIKEGSDVKPIKIEDDSKEEIKLLSDSEIKKEDSDSEESKESESEEDEDISDSEKRVQKFMKDFDAHSAVDEQYVNKGEESSDTDDEFEEQVGSNVKGDDEDEDSEDDDDDSEDNDDDSEDDDDDDDQKSTRTFSKKFTPGDRKPSNDVAEKKTVFLRNVSFLTTDEGLEEVMAEYGEFDYCLICMDKLTNHPKGTAFVKFRSKDDADKLIEKSNEDPGIFIDGRRVQCSYAISRETVQQQNESKVKQPKDKRNLHLLKVGFIVPNSTEAEGVSESDMKKRALIEITMRQKLRNLKFFVSDKRLVIHNIPRNLTDTSLRKMFKQASSPKAVITEARVMKDFSRVDKKGLPTSKGFAFVCFKRPEDALSALQKLNNNPDIFSAEKRPIVEFSIENTMALLSKERRKEKSQLTNKRKAGDECENVVVKNSSMNQEQFPKNRNKRRKVENSEKFNRSRKNSFTDPAKELDQTSQGSSLKKKKKKKIKLANSDQSLVNHKNEFDSPTKKSDGTSKSSMTSSEKNRNRKKKRKLALNDQSLSNHKNEFDIPAKKSDGTSQSSTMTSSAKKRIQRKKRKLAYEQSLINHKNEFDSPAKKSIGTSQSSNMTSFEKKRNQKKKKIQSNDHSLTIHKNEFDSSPKKSYGTSQTSNMTSFKNKKNQKNKKNRKFGKAQNEARHPKMIGKHKTKLMNKMS